MYAWSLCCACACACACASGSLTRIRRLKSAVASGLSVEPWGVALEFLSNFSSSSFYGFCSTLAVFITLTVRMKHSTSPFALGHSGDLSVGESKDCGKLFEVFAAVGQAIV